MELELNTLREREFESASSRQLDSSLLSQIADRLGDKETLYLRLENNPLIGLGAGLSNGTICVKGDLGYKTCHNMRGGLIYIKGNVERIANVYGGLIYVDGNIRELANIHEPAFIYCTGKIGEHIYAGKFNNPSQHIYCSYAPQNKNSLNCKDMQKQEFQYHYLLKIKTKKNLDNYDPFKDPQAIHNLKTHLHDISNPTRGKLLKNKD